MACLQACVCNSAALLDEYVASGDRDYHQSGCRGELVCQGTKAWDWTLKGAATLAGMDEASFLSDAQALFRSNLNVAALLPGPGVTATDVEITGTSAARSAYEVAGLESAAAVQTAAVTIEAKTPELVAALKEEEACSSLSGIEPEFAGVQVPSDSDSDSSSPPPAPSALRSSFPSSRPFASSEARACPLARCSAPSWAVVPSGTGTFKHAAPCQHAASERDGNKMLINQQDR